MLDLKQQVLEERENASYSDNEEEPKQSNPSEDLYQTKIYNRLEDNFHLSNKKALFWNISEYYKSLNKSPWSALPVTFHIENGFSDAEYTKFLNYHQRIEFDIQNKTAYKNRVLQERANKIETNAKAATKNENPKLTKKGKKMVKSGATSSSSESQSSDEDETSENEESEDDEFRIPKNMWIVKPGENTNRGNGIQVCSTLREIENIIRTCRPRREEPAKDVNAKLEDCQRRTFILQKYIDRPLLIRGRKFDIRAFGTMTSING